MEGFINFLKPPGMTSHDAVGFIRRLFQEKRVGHAGTLDPGAAGVLPIAVGRATRLIEYLDAVGKSYRAEMTFGFATDSGDDTGKVVERLDEFTMPDEAQIREVLASFTGEITQVPPAHSDIKINGRRACDLLRAGQQVEIPSRQVQIYELKLLQLQGNTALIDVKCSKGTYIRSLCADIGSALGIPATMSFLVRTSAGGFSLQHSYSVEELKDLGEKGELESILLPADKVISHIPAYELAQNRVKAFCNGLLTHDRRYQEKYQPHKDVLLRVYSQGEFLGIGRYSVAQGGILPDKVMINR
ncbi:MAG: tRNA pseudouridine(55) synthase TruB [Selenomonadaceae bacterium]|nr:tRNA pseudouridine(55) synthase TruB [Selenomonadaceae bacterium]